MIPGILDDDGKLTEMYSKLDMETRKKHKAYIAKFCKSINAYSHANECRDVKDDFWGRIEGIAKKFM